MKEKQLLRKFVLQAVIIVVVYLVVQTISAWVTSNDFSEPLFPDNVQEEMGVHSLDDVEIQFEKDGIVAVKDLYMVDDTIWVTLTPLKIGRVVMNVSNSASADSVSSRTEFAVSPDGTITDKSTGNFNHYRLYHLYIVLLFLALTILLWGSFITSLQKLSYSYHSVFCSGGAIWFSFSTFALLLTWIRNYDMLSTYSFLKLASFVFVLCAGPLALLFGIAMTISNIQLIRHEGFRVTNALGIIISCLLIIGYVLGLSASFQLENISGFTDDVFIIFEIIYFTIFAYLECFLIGSIICGTLAAIHKPAFDKDYIIILGCQIKPDGGLYPLLRGRVDKAIEFYRKQLEKTGKKAVFIPSGGQGPDEITSEAAAIKRYLLEQGIEEKQILIEDQSKNTIQNMTFSKKLIEERTSEAKVAFSTTNYHVFRSGIISRNCDFEPDGMGSNTKWYFWPNAYIREMIGMLYYKWKFVLVTLVPIIACFIAIQMIY